MPRIVAPWNLCQLWLLLCLILLSGCNTQPSAPTTAELFAILDTAPFDSELIASRQIELENGKSVSTWIVITPGPIRAVWERAKGKRADPAGRVVLSTFPVPAIKNLLAECSVPSGSVPRFEAETGRMIEWQQGATDLRLRECQVNGTLVLSAVEVCR